MEQKFKDKLMRKRRTNCTMMSRRRRRMPTGARRSVAPGLKWPWWKWVPCMEGEESSSCWWYHTLPCIFSQIIAGDVSIGRKLNYDYPNDSERGPCKVDPCCVTGWHRGLLKSISWSLTFTSEVCTHPSNPLCVPRAKIKVLSPCGPLSMRLILVVPAKLYAHSVCISNFCITALNEHWTWTKSARGCDIFSSIHF